MLGTGDFLNSAILGSVSDVYEEKYPVGTAKRLLREELRPLAEAGRLDLMIPGNHEDRITKATGDCPILDVAESLGVPYAEAGALLVITAGDQGIELFVPRTAHRRADGVDRATTTARSAPSSRRARSACMASPATRTGRPCPWRLHASRDGDRLGAPAPLRRRARGRSSGCRRYAVQRGYAPTRLGAPRHERWTGGAHRHRHVLPSMHATRPASVPGAETATGMLVSLERLCHLDALGVDWAAVRRRAVVTAARWCDGY